MVRLPDVALRPTVPDLVRFGSERHGDGDFVVMKDRQLSFRQADRLSAALAKQLLADGVGKGSRIGILLPSSTQFVVAFLAVARIGALASLFSTLFRPAELQRALRLADVDILIAPEQMFGRDYTEHLEEAIPGLASAAPPFRLHALPYLRAVWLDRAGAASGEGGVAPQPKWARRICIHPSSADTELEQDPEDITDEFLTAVEAEVFPADPLLMIWTSGSAADPKGVVHTHGVAVRKVSPQVGLGLPNSRPGRVLSLGPMFWVAGPQNILGALYSGSAVLCQERFEAAEAIEMIERERCTSTTGWETMRDRLRSHPDWPRRDTSSMVPRTPPPLSSLGDPRNMGMTETFGPHRNRELFDYKIVDPETGEDLPELEEGEFYIRGFGLMASMYKREREEVFDADGYYHTGDRGYIEDGAIYFTGRYSEIIKIAGANVSPLEVEAALMSMPEVRLATVFGCTSHERGEEVVAVVAPAPGQSIDVTAVRDHCRRLLSPYKVPTQIQIRSIEEIPLLGSGKIDKRTIRSSFREVVD
jgi:acyl-CoA synthetase (AMP-forming)/AMP-acid ligase II